MDRDALARKIKDAIFDRAEADGRVMHGDSVVDVIKGVLAMEMVEHREATAKADRSWLSTAEYPHLLGQVAPGSVLCLASGNSITLTRAAGIAPVPAIPQDG